MSSSQQEQRKEKGLATPTAESHDKEMSQHGEPKLEQQGCIHPYQWEDLIKKSYSDLVRSPFVVSIFRVAVTEDNRQISCYIKCCSTGCIMHHKNIKKVMNDLPRAVELSNAGIKFESCTCIQEIKFDQDTATIYLPRICISDHTEVLFRNLMTFEMCKPCETYYVAGYVYLMDRLIDSKEDVSLLRRKGIIENMLGSDKVVAEFFNGLCKGVVVPDLDEHIFEGLKPKVIQHYRNKYKVQFAQFLENYLSSPWKIATLLGAILGLSFGAAQTIILIIMLQK